MLGECPQAFVTRHLTSMKQRGKLTAKEFALMSLYFMLTNSVSKVPEYLLGIGEDEDKDNVMLEILNDAVKWDTAGRPRV